MEETIRYLRILLDDYKFNPETLARHLLIKVNDVYAISNGNLSVLTSPHEQYEVAHKVYSLYAIANEQPYLRVSHDLEVLINYYGLTIETIALMSNATQNDVEMLLNSPEGLDETTRLNISATIMSLRNLLIK